MLMSSIVLGLLAAAIVSLFVFNSKATFLLILGIILGFIFTLTYTGSMLRDNVGIVEEELVYKVPYQINAEFSQTDYKFKQYLINKFPSLQQDKVQEDTE